MHILFVTTAHNSLSQRLAVELTQRGHTTTVSVVTTAAEVSWAAAHHRPDLIVAPMLKTMIPEEVWRQYTCLIVHPGVKGDRGPSSLDWAISTGVEEWGVTVLQAIAEMDAGPIWSSRTFPLPQGVSKSRLYRAEVAEAAVEAVLEAVERFEGGRFVPEPLDYGRADVTGSLRPPMRQRDRAIDWQHDSTATIARKVRAADSNPGLLDALLGQELYLYGAHEEDRLTGPAGQILVQRHDAICVGTTDGALWITHLKAKGPAGRLTGIKLPAAQVLGPRLRAVPTLDLPVDDPAEDRTFREIRYREEGEVGYLSFDFYNGAMSTDQCRRLRSAFRLARSRPTKVICLLGGRDFWSNGIHLNVIEAAEDPALESWHNIQAMDDLIGDILTTPRQLVVAALRGNAGAGGAMLALAADLVYARKGVVLNPHYKSMGNLYGSEYWTYTLPRRVGAEMARQLTDACRPMGTPTARQIGFIDEAFGATLAEFEGEVDARARALAGSAEYAARLAAKQQRRKADERAKPLAHYRDEELAQMWQNFFGPDLSYHEARRRFVHKLCAPSPISLPARRARLQVSQAA